VTGNWPSEGDDEQKSLKPAALRFVARVCWLFCFLNLIEGGPVGLPLPSSLGALVEVGTRGPLAAISDFLTAMPVKRLPIIGYDVDKSIQVAKELKKFAE